MKHRAFLVAALAAIPSFVPAAPPPDASARAPAQQPTARATVRPAPSPDDPALLRYRLLQRLDAEIDATAARSKLELRAALDAIYPLPYLGVDTAASERGLAIAAVYADTAAERAGLRKGDVLRSLAGAALDSKTSLARAVRSHRVGEPVELRIARDGTEQTLTLALGRRPEEDEDFEEQFPDLFPLPAPAPTRVALDFERESEGALPAALESALGGHGRAPLWRVARGESGLALRQDDADPTGIRFPIAVLRENEAADALARVRFRYVAGRVDRAAGLVLRYRDANDYYVARANAGEADLRIFRVVKGERRTLPGALAAAPSDDARWHVLEFRAEGSQLTATLDGTARVSACDSYFLRGRAGMWTKSDAVTEFDDFVFEPLASAGER